MIVPDGDEVLAFIARLDVAGDAWANAVGVVEGVEIAVLRGSDEVVHAVPGRVTLLGLAGPVSGPLMVTLARADADGTTLTGGRLVKARSAGVTIVITEGLSAPVKGKSPSTLVGETAEAATKAAGRDANPTLRAAPGWAEIASTDAPDSEDDETDDVPRYGDRVEHAVFGLCDVMVVKGERMKIRDVHGPGRLREIHLGAMKILKHTDVDGRRVFKLVRKG